MKSQQEIEKQFLKRLSFDNCMKHNEWIIKQIELKI